MSTKDTSVRSQDASQQEKRDKENELKPDEFCFECKGSLTKSPDLINVTGQSCRRWHPECFKCLICREPMDKRQSCHIYRDQVVCRTDYLRLKRDNSTKCKRCHWPIGASDWVRKAADYVYHLACFNCDICFRQLNTGEQFVINSQPIDELDIHTNADRTSNNETIRLMCKLHFTVRNSNQREQNFTESGTGDVNTESEHHSRGRRLGSPNSSNPSPISPEISEIKHQSVTKLHGKHRQRHQTLKTGHYHQLASSDATPTASCSSTPMIASDHHQTPSQAVDGHLQQLPHSLMTQLPLSKDFPLMVSSPPSSSGLTIDENFNNQHHLVTSSGPSSTPGSSSSSSNSSSSVATLGCTSGPMTPSGCGGSGGGSTGGGGSSNIGSGGLQSKSKRVRTTFTEDQLSILQTHFQIDSNPDGQDLERIATITGLSKRVTQVWFQNSRARQKKYLIKRKPSHGSAISMVASLAHGHHHDQNHHHHNRNHHQHFSYHLGQHPSVAPMNQSIDRASERNSPSPTLDPNSSRDALQMIESSKQKIQASSSDSNFTRQFLDMSFVSNAAQPKPNSIDKENEVERDDMDSGELISQPEPKNFIFNSAAEEKDENKLRPPNE